MRNLNYDRQWQHKFPVFQLYSWRGHVNKQ